MPVRKRHLIGGMSLLAIAAAALVAVHPVTAQPFSGNGGYGRGMYGGYGMGPGMMGGYGRGGGPGMMGGAFNRPVTPDWGGGVLSYAAVQTYIGQGDKAGVADAKTNTVTFTGREVTINMVADQPGKDDQTFAVHGLVNPTLVVPLGAVVHLNLVNMDYGDTMEHGLVITPAPPPYPFMTMMATGPGLARVMPLLPWRSTKDIQQASFASLGATFVARERGTYWYLCPTPEHAQEGMFGKFVVK